MKNRLIYIAGSTDAVRFAGKFLPFASIDHPSPEVTHVLLDVPSLRADGLLRSGQRVESLLERLPEDVTVIGGKLESGAFEGVTKLDLLSDERYTAKNAEITARCAVRLALPYLGITLLHCPVLILGWGRIGKCLATLLQAIGADVTVFARKARDRAIIEALGMRAPATLTAELPRFRLVYNTIPAAILPEDARFADNCIKIELASTAGLFGNVIDGRALPARFAPESSGALIAETVKKMLEEETV